MEKKNNISLSLMAGAGLKVNNSSYKVNLLHLQNGETKAGKFITQNFKSNVNVKTIHLFVQSMILVFFSHQQDSKITPFTQSN